MKEKEPIEEDTKGESTMMSEYAANYSVPIDYDDAREAIEFKDVLKELISKEQDTAVKMEEKILAKLKKKALSRGWDRQSGIKVAPLRILASLGTQ